MTTRWYMRHRNGAIYLTVELVADQRGYCMAWPDAVGGGLLARRTFRSGLHLLRQRLDLIDVQIEHRPYDPVEVDPEQRDLPPVDAGATG